MKEIALPCGKTAFVSDDDYSRVSKLSWSDRGEGYVRARFAKSKGGHGGFVYLHRFIVSAPAGTVVDHIDGNPLNNTRENLQILTQSRNCMRSRRVKGSNGVSAHRGKWRARIRIDGRLIHLGIFSSYDIASRAVSEARADAWRNSDALY